MSKKIKNADDAKKYTDGFEKNSKAKGKKRVNVIGRDEYNKMFMNSVLKNKAKS